MANGLTQNKAGNLLTRFKKNKNSFKSLSLSQQFRKFLDESQNVFLLIADGSFWSFLTEKELTYLLNKVIIGFEIKINWAWGPDLLVLIQKKHVPTNYTMFVDVNDS